MDAIALSEIELMLKSFSLSSLGSINFTFSIVKKN